MCAVAVVVTHEQVAVDRCQLERTTVDDALCIAAGLLPTGGAGIHLRVEVETGQEQACGCRRGASVAVGSGQAVETILQFAFYIVEHLHTGW